MALSKAAAKLLAYLGIYKLNATQLDSRLIGTLDSYYNASWVEGGITSTPRRVGAHPTRGSLFEAAIVELKAAGY